MINCNYGAVIQFLFAFSKRVEGGQTVKYLLIVILEVAVMLYVELVVQFCSLQNIRCGNLGCYITF